MPGQRYAYRFQAVGGGKSIITPRNFFTVTCVAGVQTINETIIHQSKQRFQKRVGETQRLWKKLPELKMQEKKLMKIHQTILAPKSRKKPRTCQRKINIRIFQFISFFKQLWRNF